MEYKRTNGTDKDFIDNCFLMEQDLDRRVGKEIQREKYNQYNQLDQIHQAIVVYYNDLPIGGDAIRKYNDEIVKLKRIFIHNNWQRQGIGMILVIKLMKWVKELRYSKMILETGELYLMYQKIGFRIIPNYGPYKNMPESLCMEKEL